MKDANLKGPRVRPQVCPNLSTIFLLAGLCFLNLFLPGPLSPALRAAGPEQVPGNELVGTYRVEQVIDLGSEVRVTLHIRLINNTNQDLGIIDFALRDLRPSARPVIISAGTRLQAREGTTVEHEFAVSRTEYESWSRSAHPTLEVRLLPSDGRELRRTIQLMRLDARSKP